MWKLNSSPRLWKLCEAKHTLALVTTAQQTSWAFHSVCPQVRRSQSERERERLCRKEKETFLYNAAIVPAMTSANNNQPHNQKYVTQ